MKSKRIFFLIVTCFLANRALAQPPLWEIYSTSNQPFVNVIVDGYRSDSLYIKSMNQLIVLHHDSIRYLIRRNSSKFGIGFILGAIAGGIYGNAISRGSDGPFSELGSLSSVTFGILIGGALGGAIGSVQGIDTKYQIDKLDSETKRKLLTRLFPNA